MMALLLALISANMDNIQDAQMVFHRIFHKVATLPSEEHDWCTQCTCRAKMLGAYALTMSIQHEGSGKNIKRDTAQLNGKVSHNFN